ncbi:sodium/phosphate symporter [Scenedesmus sp. NREL 46B-D3]|nr:sodium/phosphate symporter [Scenedesmus sp. NREL 46B-D3]
MFEFLGAMLLGGQVTRTIAGGIAKTATFAKFPSLFAFGMLTAETGAMVWVLLASYLELPVSTTHSIVGGIIGFALALGGGGAVVWYEPKADFPYINGIVPIVISWFLSPLAAALIAFIIFVAVRTMVLRRARSTDAAFYVLPVLILVTIWVTKGVRGITTININTAAWISAAAAGGSSILGTAILWPVMKRVLAKYDALQSTLPGRMAIEKWLQPVEVGPEDKSVRAYFNRFRNVALSGITHDIHKEVKQDEGIMAMHADAERCDPRTEEVLKVLQVKTRLMVKLCNHRLCMSFAHGANDVANAIGTFAATYSVYQNFTVPGSNSAVYPWILAVGATGIVVGLATYGYNIMRVLGVKALLRAARAINWLLYAKMVFTLIIAAAISAALFLMGTHSPSQPDQQRLIMYQGLLLQQSNTSLRFLNSSNNALATPSAGLAANVCALGSSTAKLLVSKAWLDANAVASNLKAVNSLLGNNTDFAAAGP